MKPSNADGGGVAADKIAAESAMWESQLVAARAISNPELRAREEAYVLDKIKKLARARQEREKESAELLEAETRRRREDARLRGYQSSGLYTHALPLRGAHEALAEQALELDAKNAGESTGQAWVKSEHGWTRKVNPVRENKSELSESELSTQAYEAVDLRFGLRRSRSWDFLLAVSCLTVLLRKYAVLGAGSLQHCMHRDMGVMMKTYLRFPQATAAVQELLREAVAAFSGVRRSQAATGQSTTAADERVAQVELWQAQVAHEQIRRSGARQAAALAVTAGVAAPVDDNNGGGGEAGNALPHEVLLLIFSYLRDVRDLVRVTAVCTRWYDVGNDDFLYRQLLLTGSTRVPVEELEARLAKVKSCKTVFMQIHSKLLVPMTGLYLCSACDCLFWAGKNVGKQCQRQGEFGRHQPGVALNPSSLVQGLLVAWGRHRFR